MTVLLMGLFSAVFAYVLTSIVRRYALKNAILDVPNARSSHDVPTPRGGGVGIIAPVIGLLVLHPSLMVPPAVRWGGVVAIIFVAALGWIDDHRSLPVRHRLVGHLAAGALVAGAAASLGIHGLHPALPVAVAALWWIFWTVSAINVVNFIDGIDGIIGLQALVFGVFALLAAGLHATPAGLMGVVLAGSALGFLVLNWSPARIFMGDVGSGSLGVVFVLLGLLTMHQVGWTIVHAFLPLMPIFVDEVLTMSRRIARGESLSEPHRTHVYQRLVQAGIGHGPVAAFYGFLALLAGGWSLAVPVASSVFWLGAAGMLVMTFAVLSGLREWAERRARVTAVAGSAAAEG